MDYSELEGGLARMLDRLQAEGTATKNPEADAFLRQDANALLIGLLLDQRVLAETAFIGPLKLKERLGHWDMRRLANMDPEAFKTLFAISPAVHRFTNVMADRVQALARVLTETYHGDAAYLWAEAPDLKTVEQRIRALPGFGPLKAKKIKYLTHYFGHKSFS